MTDISILVAVYNSEEYLNRCIDSLLAQTLRNIQIICIDDGSTDNSLEILRDYARKDTRLEIIALGHNTGQAHARNEGLKRANGKYITFVDSDDWLSEDALEKGFGVLESYKDTDCVLFNVEMFYPQTGQMKPYHMQKFDRIDGKKAFEESLDWKIHGLYIIAANIHKRHPYDESCRAYSDDNTTRIHYLESRKVACCDGTYYYYQNPGSVTHRISARRFDHIRANESMKQQLQDIGIDEKTLDIYENVRWKVLVDTYMFYFKNRKKLTLQERRQGMAEMKRIWKGMEIERLEKRLKGKFGFRPLRCSWTIFRIQEEIYFSLKSLLGR